MGGIRCAGLKQLDSTRMERRRAQLAMTIRILDSITGVRERGSGWIPYRSDLVKRGNDDAGADKLEGPEMAVEHLHLLLIQPVGF